MSDTPVLDEVEVEESPVVAEDPAPQRRTRRIRPAVLAVAAIVLALTALSGYLGWQLKTDRDTHAAAAAARQAAEGYAVTLTSVDSADLDANFAAVLDGATGEFRDIYSASSAKLRKLLVDHRAAGHGVVIDSGIQSASKDQVVVLLFVDQTVSNTEVPDPRVDRSRMVMTMQRIDGAWKAAKVELP